MYSVTVRDHVLIAHTFRGAVFGPAQALHGATFVVDVEIRRQELDGDGVVVDIGLLTQLLKEVLAPFAYKNLDAIPELHGRNTTVEFMAGEIHRRARSRIREGALGTASSDFASMRIEVKESHVAKASFDGPIEPI